MAGPRRAEVKSRECTGCESVFASCDFGVCPYCGGMGNLIPKGPEPEELDGYRPGRKLGHIIDDTGDVLAAHALQDPEQIASLLAKAFDLAWIPEHHLRRLKTFEDVLAYIAWAGDHGDHLGPNPKAKPVQADPPA